MSPATDVLIRAQEPEDLAGLSEVFNQPGVIRGTLFVPYVPREQLQKHLSTDNPNVMRLVALVGGKVVGTASLNRHNRPRRAHTAWIGIGVHDAYANRGIGTALMSAMIDVADHWWNLKRLELEVFADNDRAIALYERFGFEREGLFRAHAFRDGQFDDTVAMGRVKP